MKLLKPFGHGGSTHKWGYDLPLLIGHLEGMAQDEEDNLGTGNGPKAKRFEKVEDAIILLNEAMEMGDEECGF